MVIAISKRGFNTIPLSVPEKGCVALKTPICRLQSAPFLLAGPFQSKACEFAMGRTQPASCNAGTTSRYDGEPAFIHRTAP